MNVQFLCDVSDQQKANVFAAYEVIYGNARCDVHGEQMRLIVTKVDSRGRFSYERDPCCDEFHLSLCLEHDRKFELRLWNEWYPNDGSRE
jgi:hypothetical protein